MFKILGIGLINLCHLGWKIICAPREKNPYKSAGSGDSMRFPYLSFMVVKKGYLSVESWGETAWKQALQPQVHTNHTLILILY